MNCIIPCLNLKVVAKALQALAKVGDELFIEAKKEKLTLVTLNLRKTVCVRYHFLDSFFSSYDVDESEFNEINQAIICKIHMKVLLPLLKGTHLDKKIEFIKLEYESNSDVLLFKMRFKCDDILMTHKLRVMDPESLTIQFLTDSGSNNILATSSFFNQLLAMFSNQDDEITLEVSKEKVIAKNYVSGAPVKSKCVRSQVNLIASEFNIYEVSTETAINFSLKPLRTAVQFAEGFNLNVGFNFESGGRPLAIILKNPTFEVNFIVATLNPYSDLQSSMATTSIPTKRTQLNADNENVTIEDQKILDNVDWDDFDTNTEPPKRSKTHSNKASFKEIMEKAKQKSKNKENVKKINGHDKTTYRKNNSTTEPSTGDVEKCNEALDVIPRSPESPRTKKAKLVFGRCFEPTFTETSLGEILAPNSDSE